MGWMNRTYKPSYHAKSDPLGLELVINHTPNSFNRGLGFKEPDSLLKENGEYLNGFRCRFHNDCLSQQNKLITILLIKSTTKRL
jgi:hypothetical protein